LVVQVARLGKRRREIIGSRKGLGFLKFKKSRLLKILDKIKDQGADQKTGDDDAADYFEMQRVKVHFLTE
jgi:hypothetical protein